MASATFKVNGTVPTGAVSVSYGDTITLALVITIGAASIVWDVVGRSHTDSALPTITPAGSPVGATATFTFRSAPGDSAGRSYRVRCTVTDGNGNSGSSVAVIGVLGSSGVVPFCHGETTERNAELGWAGDMNAAIEGMGAGNVGLAGYLDVSRAPYGAIPNDRTKAAANTVAIQAAIDDAQSSGSVVWFPPGEWWVAKNAAGADANGWTCALSLGDQAITMAGCGAWTSVLCYCSSGGNYSSIIHHPETANALTESYRWHVHFRGLGFNCDDDLGSPGDQALHAIKSRKLVNASIIECRAVAAGESAFDLDFCFGTLIHRCDISYNSQHGVVWGARAFNQNSNQIRDCTFAYNGGAGVVATGGVSNLIQGALFQNNGMTGVLVWNTGSLTIDTCYFEGQCEDSGPSGSLSYPDSGLHFTNDATGRYTEIFILRGSIDMTAPKAWTYTLNPSAGGDYWDPAASNPGVIVSGCYVAEYTANEVFIGTNAANGLAIRACHQIAGTVNPILALYADGFYGSAQRFSVADCVGFAGVSAYSYAYGGALHDIGLSRIDGVSRRNLLGHDPIADCMTRIPNAAHAYLTGELSLSTATSFKGKPAYRLSGEALFAGKGITIDTSAQPELAGKYVYLGAMVYIPSLAGAWPTQTVAFAVDSGTDTDPHITSRPFTATGWQFRSILVYLPAATSVKLGFSMLAAGEAFMADPVIAELGAPYEEVVSDSRQSGWRCALNLQFDKAGNEAKSFGANGTTTVAGIACTVADYANSSPAMNVDSGGTGLVLTPVAATSFGVGDVSSPRVEFKLADLIPGYHPGMKLRIWVANPTNNSAANYDGAMIGIWDGGNFSAASSGGYILDRGKVAGGTGFAFYWAKGGSVLATAVEAITISNYNNTVCILVDDLGHRSPQYEWGQSVGTGWPDAWNVGIGADAATGMTALTTANARVGLSAQRYGSGTALVTKFTNLRIDYQP